MIKKPLLLIVLIAAFAGMWLLDIHQLFTLHGLKDSLQQFELWQAQQPLLLALVFFLIYILAAALSFPGVGVMTVAAGALFGVVWGLVLVSFASSVGAVLAFLSARYLFRDTVQQRFNSRLQKVNDGMARDGAFYLFTLRIVPVVPFFLINLLMGLTRIRIWTFYWVSQLGMLPGTLLYVNAGTQLAAIDEMADILSPGLLVSLLLLGMFPWLAKKLGQKITTLQTRNRSEEIATP